MKSSRSKIVLSVGLALMLVAGVAAAEHLHRAHMREGGMFGEHALSFFADYLNLTDAQQSQIKQIIAKEKPTLQPLWEQEHQSHQAMIQLVASGNFDEAKAQAIAQQAGQTHTQLMLEHARVAAEAYQVLTPDQKTKLSEFLAKRQQRFQEHMREHNMDPAPNQ